jgi:26S proteasome regulatory subunit N10
VFVGSPVEVDEKELIAVAKKLKKNNVAVDVVNFGEDIVNEDKLEKFVSTVCNKDGNRYATRRWEMKPGEIASRTSKL